MIEQDTQRSGGSAPTDRLLPWLLLVFIGSGCAALIYEVVWLQLLQLVIGLTAVSLGILLGTFMGGMCLGSLLLPRLISPQRHPLRVYALIELGIGLVGIAVLFAVPYLGQIYAAKAGHGFPSILLRSVLAAVCLLPPTLLMGATLPAIARWVETTPRGVSWLGFFYGGNIAGAVFGCLLAGFYLLRVHNMAVATYVAATINFVLALIAFGLSSFTSHRPAALEPAAGPTRLVRGAGAVYVAIALSGLGALGAEVVWTRLLSLMFGATTYTFSIILAVFLVGLGIGSSAGSYMARSTRRPRFALGLCQMLLVLASAWTAGMITESLPYWPVNPTLATSPWYTFQMDIARCFWAILPAAILWGASFPLALAAVASGKEDAGKLVGGVYAANTVGAILGALAFSLLVVPLVGSQWAQRLLIVVPAVSALLMLIPVLREAPAASAATAPVLRPALGFGRSLAIIALVGVTGLLAWRVAVLPWGVVAFGRFVATYANRLAPGIVAEKDVPAGGGNPDIFCTYVGEGLNGTVAVTKWKSGARMFHSAGKVQASSEPQDMRLQRLLGHISALAHKKPESVLVVACGAGVTAGTFVTHPDVKRIVICDIEPLVPRVVAPMFEYENHAVLKDPRTEVVLDDGRHYIRTTKEKFDIITSDPIDPWVKGCAALNTVDYYQMCKDHLKPGGVMSLWIPLYESNSQTIKSVLATFFKVFPKGVLWSNESQGSGYDAVLFGQAEGTEINLDELQQRLDRPDHAAVKQSLAQVEFFTAADMLATYAGQARDLQEWMADAQINTDQNLRLQYLAGMAFNSYIGTELLNEIRHYYRFPDNIFVGSNQAKQLLKTVMKDTSSTSSSSTTSPPN
jgi:spermidine synthase